MKNIKYNIKRLEEFKEIYETENIPIWIKDLVLPLYDKILTKLYKQQREQYE